MKRAGKLVVGAIAAISLLAGGTFAAFAVVDNANAIGIKVSPGTISEQTTQKVVLEWGESTNLANVSNLGVGQKAKAGEVVLKASENYTGRLNVKLQDITVGKDPQAKKFIDYLNVYVNRGSKTAEQMVKEGEGFVGKVPEAAEDYTADFTVNGSSEGVVYSVFVELDSSALAFYDAIKADQVYVTVDWNKAEGDTETDVNDTTYYLYDEHNVFNGAAYAYAWGGTTRNAEFPGVAMEYDKATGLYSVDVKTTFDHIIFSGNGEQTVDLELATAKRYFVLGEKTEGKYGALSQENAPVTLNADYYVVGTFNNWKAQADWALVEDANNKGKYVYSNADGFENTTANKARLKVWGKDGDIWYGAEGGVDYEFTVHEDKNVTGFTLYLNNAGVVYVDPESITYHA